MPLVIYLGLHAITREPALLLPSEQKQITLATLKVNDTAALRDKPDSGQQKGKHVAKNNPPVLFLESLSEDATGTIKQWLQQETTQHITLVWLQPVPYIAAKLAEGEDTESTLQAWQQMANATLNLFRQHRRQITLIGADIGGAPPKHDKASLLTLPPAKHAPIFTLAASQLLAASSAMQENADHLSASSIAVYPQTEEVVDQVINTLRDHQKTSQQNNDLKQQLGDEKEAHQKAQQQVAAQSQELTSVKEENDLVIAELHRVQELLESKLIEREELVKQRDDLRNHYEIAIKQRDSALQQLEQRFTQLQQLHLELKKYQAEQKNLTSRIDRYQTQLNVQKEEFQQALQEQSTWLTWVRCNAAHYSAATYKHSRSHRKTLKQQAALVQASQHFDKQWYLEQYPDIAKSTMDPVEHYLKFGVLEARNPSPNFDTKFYITRNPDIAESGYQPLLHYIQHGQMEHRQTRLEQLQLPSPQQPSEEASNGENAQASQETR